MKKDIEKLEDVKLFVDEFYGKVKLNPLIGPIFLGAIDDWPAHLARLYNFWQTVLLNEHTYYGSPFVPHSQLPVEKKHFDAWLKLFFETIDKHFAGETADRAKWQAEKMAVMFQHKIEYFKNNPDQKIL